MNLIQEVRASRLPRSKTKTRRFPPTRIPYMRLGRHKSGSSPDGTVLVARTPGHGVTWTVGGTHHDMTQEDVETDEDNLVGMRFLEPESNLINSGNQSFLLPLPHPRLHLSTQLPRRTRRDPSEVMPPVREAELSPALVMSVITMCRQIPLRV